MTPTERFSTLEDLDKAQSLFTPTFFENIEAMCGHKFAPELRGALMGIILMSIHADLAPSEKISARNKRLARLSKRAAARAAKLRAQAKGLPTNEAEDRHARAVKWEFRARLLAPESIRKRKIRTRRVLLQGLSDIFVSAGGKITADTKSEKGSPFDRFLSEVRAALPQTLRHNSPAAFSKAAYRLQNELRTQTHPLCDKTGYFFTPEDLMNDVRLLIMQPRLDRL